MREDNLVDYKNPGIALPVADVLTEVLRRGASTLLEQAVEAEVAEVIARFQELKDERGRQRVVRNGHLPERRVQTGIGELPVKAPRVRDRAGELKFSSSILPRYLRRTRSLEELLPWLYLKGLSTGDFSSALTALLGQDAPGLSANTISRLKEVWKGEYEQWSKRSLSGKQYVYVWADGVYFGVRLEDARQCILVLEEATSEGKKEVLGIADGYRESETSWKELLLDLRQRGLTIDPKLATGDGSLGFWKADSPLGLDKWLTAIWLIANAKNGISSYEIHRALGVTQKSAWFMLHRIRLAMQNGSIEKLSGHVEVDETFIGGKARSMHRSERARKIHGTGAAGKVAVMGLLERHGEVRTMVVRKVRRTSLRREIDTHVEPGSMVYSDALKSYNDLNSPTCTT